MGDSCLCKASSGRSLTSNDVEAIEPALVIGVLRRTMALFGTGCKPVILVIPLGHPTGEVGKFEVDLPPYLPAAT